MQDFFEILDALHVSMVLMLYSTQILMNEIISFETFRLFVVQREMESCEKQAKKGGKNQDIFYYSFKVKVRSVFIL